LAALLDTPRAAADDELGVAAEADASEAMAKEPRLTGKRAEQHQIDIDIDIDRAVTADAVPAPRARPLAVPRPPPASGAGASASGAPAGGAPAGGQRLSLTDYKRRLSLGPQGVL
jgi:hypothetical protein